MAKVIARHGERGRWVKVFTEPGSPRVRVQWKVPGRKIETRSFTGSEARATAKAFAEGIAGQLSRGSVVATKRLTMQQLWDRYVEAEFPHLRPNTKRIYTANYRTWCVRWGWGFIAEHTTPEMADELRADLASAGWQINSMRKVIYDVKRVFAWAEGRELIQRNRLRLYRFKVAKEDRPIPPPEYRAEDFAKILAALDPLKGTQWRPWVALTLCGVQGARQHAVLHLKPTDFDLDANVIHWRAEWDKNGMAWQQPLRDASREALLVALRWRTAHGYIGPWLISSAKQSREGPYTMDSLWLALQAAERRAGIPKLKGRGAHGLRRMLAGDVSAITGDPLMGLRSIGDKDVRMVERYVQNRPDVMAAAFAKLDWEQAPKAQPNRDGTNETGASGNAETPATIDRGT